MQDRLPDTLDPASLTAAGREYRGPLSTAGMQRLAALVHDTEVPPLQVKLFAGRNPGGVGFLEGHIDGVLHLQCQRCLSRMEWPLTLEFKLALISGEREAERLADQYEPLLVGGDRLSVRDIIEDELLLALPSFPQHGTGDACVLPEYRQEDIGSAEEEKPNPFAVLESLKHK